MDMRFSVSNSDNFLEILRRNYFDVSSNLSREIEYGDLIYFTCNRDTSCRGLIIKARAAGPARPILEHEQLEWPAVYNGDKSREFKTRIPLMSPVVVNESLLPNSEREYLKKNKMGQNGIRYMTPTGERPE
jgi:hypothetical protein